MFLGGLGRGTYDCLSHAQALLSYLDLWNTPHLYFENAPSRNKRISTEMSSGDAPPPEDFISFDSDPPVEKQLGNANETTPVSSLSAATAKAKAALFGLMPPPPPKSRTPQAVRPDSALILAEETSEEPRARPKQKVLDEDEWTMQIEAIVERDYFPDLPKLKDRLEWLEARNSGDPARISEAIGNITARRVGCAPNCTLPQRKQDRSTDVFLFRLDFSTAFMHC